MSEETLGTGAGTLQYLKEKWTRITAEANTATREQITGTRAVVHTLTRLTSENSRREIELTETDLAQAFRVRVAALGAPRADVQGAARLDRPSQPGVEVDRSTLVITAHMGGVIVGTMTVRLDGPRGLPADFTFRQELNELRQAGIRMAEFDRLGIADHIDVKAVMASLFHVGYMFAFNVHQCSYAVITLRARHSALFERVLALERVGGEEFDARSGCHSLLTIADFHKVGDLIAQYAGRPDAVAGERSFYPFAFAPAEAAGLLGRLLRFTQHR